MAQPIPLEIPPRNPRAELRSRLEQAPEEHAEAVFAAYEVLQQLHERGVLEIMRGALAASDEILEEGGRQRQNARSHSRDQESPFLAPDSRQHRTGMVQGHLSRQFQKVLPRPLRNGRNQSVCLDCYADSQAKTVSAACCSHRFLAGLWASPAVTRKIRFHVIN